MKQYLLSNMESRHSIWYDDDNVKDDDKVVTVTTITKVKFLCISIMPPS